MKNKTTLNPTALYWSSFNRFEMRLPGQCVIDCSHSGQCDADVDYWAPLIAKQCDVDNFPNRPTPNKIRAELEEYGAWDAEELQDDEQNWHRLIWIAAGNLMDDDAPDCSEPVRN